MALFARAAKLGPGAYGARPATARPSIRQWLLAVTETVVIKPSRLNIVAQSLSNSLPRSLPWSLYTPLSRVGSDQTTGKRAGGVDPLQEKREVAQHLYLAHTLSGKQDSVALHYMVFQKKSSPPLKLFGIFSLRLSLFA